LLLSLFDYQRPDVVRGKVEIGELNEEAIGAAVRVEFPARIMKGALKLIVERKGIRPEWVLFV
jgi:hypothetical protein